MRIRIERGRRASASARALGTEMGVRLIRIRQSTFNDRPTDVIINWGCSERRFPNAVYFNEPEAVSNAIYKLRGIKLLEKAGVTTTLVSRDPDTAARWLSEGKKVLARQSETGHGGDGITVLSAGDEVVSALYYSLYVPKFDEFRVHVVDGEMVDTVHKRRRHGTQVSNEVRNHANGWVFCRTGIEVPDEVRVQSINAVAALNLRYGAVDVGYTRRGGRATVYEVNTAPGLDGSTVGIVASAIRRAVYDGANKRTSL